MDTDGDDLLPHYAWYYIQSGKIVYEKECLSEGENVPSLTFIASDIYKNAFNSYFCCFSLSYFGVLQYFCTGMGKIISKMNRRKMKIGSLMMLKASFPVCNHYGSRSGRLFLAQQVCRRHCGL